MSLSGEVSTVTERYLGLLDAVLPGKLEGLYLVGSVALDDYQPGRSDVDFVAVTERPLDPAELDALNRVHKQLKLDIPKPHFDGIYVSWQDLTRDPREIEYAPHTHEGRLERSRGFEANPSVWLVLRTRGIAARGPKKPDVWQDDAATRRWNLDNLTSYWRHAVTSRRDPLGRTFLLASDRAMRESVAWCVPGVSRLHCTITTGDITSKQGACRYALDRFPAVWHPLVREALALRRGEAIGRRDRRAQLEELLTFMEFVIEDAERQGGSS